MTVLYCLISGAGAAEAPAQGGLPDAAPPRALPVSGSLTAIAATLPDTLYDPDAVTAKLRDMDWVSKAALGHEQLLESLLRTGATVVPMKMLTLFSGDERMLKDLASQRKRLEAAAKRVAGCEEYGLRIVPVDGPAADAPRERPSSGIAFLERKKQVRDTAREQASARVAFAREAYETLAKAARASVNRPIEGEQAERPLLDAAFLVARDARAAFGAAADALGARAPSQHCALRLTGPWPAYHFVEAARGES